MLTARADGGTFNAYRRHLPPFAHFAPEPNCLKPPPAPLTRQRRVVPPALHVRRPEVMVDDRRECRPALCHVAAMPPVLPLRPDQAVAAAGSPEGSTGASVNVIEPSC